MITSGADLRLLNRLSWADREVAGVKAAVLGELMEAGFPVPAGFVLTTSAQTRFLNANHLDGDSPPEAFRAASLPSDIVDALREACAAMGNVTVAVRSSAVAEDLPDASFAGQLETVLGVRGVDAIGEAAKRCWASAASDRVRAYASTSSGSARPGMAVLVQQLIEPDAAGVAFTADPLTGERDHVVIEAVKGLGERLVSGQSVGDEWVVRDSSVSCRRSTEDALTSDQALAVAEMARRVERHRGSPQDIEWATSGGKLFLLQARPMTALPTPVDWASPVPGGWMRNFRYGEWLPDPVTPLFETWILPRIDRSFIATEERLVGLRTKGPTYVVVHGWCFANPMGRSSPLDFAVQALTHPRVMRALALQFSDPAVADAMLVKPLERRWREDVMPRYRALVASLDEALVNSNPPDLVRLIDAVADLAGEYLVMLALGGGSAWKVEAGVAKFYAKHLRPVIGGSHQDLLCGLDTRGSQVQPHFVQSLDWIAPTLGELGMVAAGGEDDGRRARLRERRIAGEHRSRTALAGEPRLERQFEKLLTHAQRYAVLREEQSADLTIGWPLMRRAAIQLGEELRRRGALDVAEEVFFLSLEELKGSLAHESAAQNLAGAAAGRRTEWEGRRKLAPPLVIGRLPGFFARKMTESVESMRVPAGESSNAIRGLPASPGRVKGPIRIIRGQGDFANFQRGDILVTQAAMPAWTPLFLMAAAMVTDTGTLAAHASLVAREVGIPAVVGTGDATARLHDGQIVTVDGSAGVVELDPDVFADEPERAKAQHHGRNREDSQHGR